MNTDLTSLDRLHEVIVPPPVPWWPPGPGWIVLGVALTLGLVWWLIRMVRAWQSNCYRREALALLGTAEGTGAGLATLIKRVALSAYPREQVASLIGEKWLVFLDETGRTTAFTNGPGRWLVRLPYEPGLLATLPSAEYRDLLATIREWVTRHRREETKR
jgi:hypothetical protein